MVSSRDISANSEKPKELRSVLSKPVSFNDLRAIRRLALLSEETRKKSISLKCFAQTLCEAVTVQSFRGIALFQLSRNSAFLGNLNKGTFSVVFTDWYPVLHSVTRHVYTMLENSLKQ